MFPFMYQASTISSLVIDRCTGEVLSGYPDGQPDHGIDTIRYALEPSLKLLSSKN